MQRKREPLRSLVLSSIPTKPDPTTTWQTSGRQEVRFFALIICTISLTPIAIASKWSVVYSCFHAFFLHKNDNDGNQNWTRLLRSGFLEINFLTFALSSFECIMRSTTAISACTACKHYLTRIVTCRDTAVHVNLKFKKKITLKMAPVHPHVISPFA